MKRDLTSVKSFVCRTILLASVMLVNSNSRGQAPPDSSRIIRVLTYNIYHGETMKGDFNLDTIAGIIKAVDPDLVALQEVDFRTNRARKMDLATELGLRTGLAPLFGQAMPFDGGEYGEGVLSKYSFLSTKNHPLKAREGKEPRAALEVHVVLKSSDTVRFVGTHLDHTRDETDRINQANALNDIFAKDDIPTVLAGDLNARPESETMSILFREWTKSSSTNAPTAPSASPKAKIDYILFRPAKRWKVLDTRVIHETVGSDHCPVLSVLELLPED
ncbi:MAG: endonuclease/exonuclease/phosphatase family protein [Cytophagales bacterium]|nr:endonuclease/exonuclease/phosphatase family protein [Cytophagales bacterium]